MKQLTQVEHWLMLDLVQDWYGLWELPSEGESVPPELVGAADQRSALVVALRRLIALGLIQVGVRPRLSADPPSVAYGNDAAALLEADDSWAIPEGNQNEVVVTATALADRLFDAPGSA